MKVKMKAKMKKNTNQKIINSKARVKKYGEVYTTHELVNEVLDKIPKKCFIENLSFLEPSCGNGNFLTEILKRKVLNKHSVIDSLKQIYGIDIIPDNVINSRKILFQTALDLGMQENDQEEAIKTIKKNIKLGNTLEIDFETFFN